MKKTLTITTAFVLFVSSFLIAVFYGTIDFNQLLDLQSCTTVHIDDNIEYKDPHDFLEVVQGAAEENDLDIGRISYQLHDNMKNATTVLYTNADLESPILSNIVVDTDETFSAEKGDEAFLSTVQTDDSNQIGKIQCFQTANQLEIRPFSAQCEQSLTANYVVDTKDTALLSGFVQDLQLQGIHAEVIQGYTEAGAPINQSVISVSMIIFLCLYAFVIITFIYYLTSRYKEFAIRKLFGKDYRSMIRQNVCNDFCKILGVAEISNLLLTLIVMGIYNHFAKFIGYIAITILAQIAIGAITILIVCLLAQLVKTIKVSYMLKKKKTSSGMKAINMMVKMVFVFVGVFACILSMSNISYIITQNQDIDRWMETRDYATADYAPSVPPSNGKFDVTSEYQDSLHIKRFFELTNNAGGVLISPSQYYFFLEQGGNEPNSYVQMKSYDPSKESVYVNNNYLQLNPIYDINGNPVCVSDEHTNTMTLLVPEKYRPYEADILDIYTKDRTWKYYSEEDKYKRAQGEDLDFDSSDINQVISYHGALPVQIVYVQNNQSYFTYRTDSLQEARNRIVDPIAMVVNNSNLSGEEYKAILSRGEYFVKVDDMNHPMQSIEAFIQEANVEPNIVRITSLYQQVEQSMHDITQKILGQLFVFALSLLVIIAIIVISIFHYLEDNSQINAVRRLHGFSFAKKHGKYFCRVLLFWSCSFILQILFLNGFYLQNAIYCIWMLGIVLSLAVLECIFTIIIIKGNEIKRVKNILKE